MRSCLLVLVWLLASLGALAAPGGACAARHKAVQPKPPKLVAIPGSVSGPPGLKSTLMSDGVRYATFRLSSGKTEILDTDTGQRYEIPEGVCPELTESEQPFKDIKFYAFMPEVLTESELLSDCHHGEASISNTLLVTSLPSLATAEAKFQPSPFQSPYRSEASLVGSRWTRYIRCEAEKIGLACPEEKIFNFVTGAVYPGKVKPSMTTYANLDASEPIQPLCSPVRLAHVHFENYGFHANETVVGVEGPWVLIRQWLAGGRRSKESTYLLAWHCGRRHAVNLGHIGEGAQLGAGLVSWFSSRQVLNVENLSTRRRWTWTIAQAKESTYKAVHTADDIFVTESESNDHYYRSVLMASLKALGASRYRTPEPAVVSQPE